MQRAVLANNALPVYMCEDDRYRMWLKHYSPFCQALDEKGNRLLTKVLHQCAQEAEMRIVPKDTVLFNPGEEDNLIYYLLSGQVRIKNNSSQGGSRFQIISSKVPGQYPEPVGGDIVPRSSHAQAVRRSVFLCLEMENPRLLDSLHKVISPAGQGAAGEGAHSEEDGDDRWIERLLSQRWLKLVDAKFVQNLFACAERVEVRPGEVLQEYKKPVDYVHLIEKGSCLLFAGRPVSLLMAVGMMANRNGAFVRGQSIRTLASGACLGDVHAINPSGGPAVKPSPFTAQMQTAGVVHRIERKEFSDRFGHYVLDWLIARIGWSQGSVR